MTTESENYLEEEMRRMEEEREKRRRKKAKEERGEEGDKRVIDSFLEKGSDEEK